MEKMYWTFQITPIAEGQIAAAGEMLARAFFNDPLCVYAQPDPAARLSQFGWVFSRLIREGASQQSAYVSTFVRQPHGVAVWAPPQAGEPTVSEVPGSEMEQWEQRLGPGAYHRFTTAYRHFEHIHHRCVAGPHWYLGLLGVSPGLQRHGIGSALLAPVLRRADQDGLPCHLETFVPENVPFYQRHGFQVAHAGTEPLSGIRYWAMAREPSPPRTLRASPGSRLASTRRRPHQEQAGCRYTVMATGEGVRLAGGR